jgi:hypothetical protein
MLYVENAGYSIKCLPGTYCTTLVATSMEECIRCGKGTYLSGSGSTYVISCKGCPAGISSQCLVQAQKSHAICVTKENIRLQPAKQQKVGVKFAQLANISPLLDRRITVAAPSVHLRPVRG